MQNTIERYEERLKAEKEDATKTLNERIARVQLEKESVETKYEQKRKALKELEKNIQQSSS
jgi:chaperonin cofactor prefoldin